MARITKSPIIQHMVFQSQSIEKFIERHAVRLAKGRKVIWPTDQRMTLKRVELARLDRIGGREGFSGSRVFVADFVGQSKISRKEFRSYPLLLKVAYGKKLAEKLYDERRRYDAISGKLPTRCHARILNTEKEDSFEDEKCILWSEFVEETGIQNLPDAAPRTLRDVFDHQGWEQARNSLTTLYDIILLRLHQGIVDNNFAYFAQYEFYRKEGWVELLEAAIGSKAPRVKILNQEIRNPAITYRKLQQDPFAITGNAHISGIHGDLHPNNVLVSKSQPAVLIDFGLATASFHTIADFVVMEASIKFFSLKWHVSRVDLRLFEDAFAQDYLPDQPLNDEDLDHLYSTVKLIRSKAAAYIDVKDYERQYLLPLFCVTMGLFKYASQVNNLAHLILSAGILAEKLEEKLLM